MPENASYFARAKPSPLTLKAFDLLLALVEHHGRLLEKAELLRLVWPDTLVEEANLSSYISLIRKALGDGENGQRYIETMPNHGYRFLASVREVTDRTAVSEAALSLSNLLTARHYIFRISAWKRGFGKCRSRAARWLRSRDQSRTHSRITSPPMESSTRRL